MKLIRQQFIFDDPTPTPECHASTIVRLDDGSLIAAWFAGTKEGAEDVMIWVSICRDGVWGEPRCVTDEQGIPHWNPVLFRTDEQTVTLFYKLGHKISDWKTMIIQSCDGGESWSSPGELIDGDESGGRGPVKNKAIRASNGRILAPGSTERGPWRPFVDVFEPRTGWIKKPINVVVGEGEKINLIQPTLWEAPEGHIHAIIRSNQGKIYRSDSEDFGDSWCDAYPTDMPNNNSGIDCVLLDDGRLVLACNPVGGNWGKRTPLSIFVSTDNGATFEKQLDLETGEGGFAYPAVIYHGDRIFITYTWNRKKIAFCEIEI